MIDGPRDGVTEEAARMTSNLNGLPAGMEIADLILVGLS